MSVKENPRKNSESITPRLRDGEEPTELLLSLVSSPLIDLKDRGLAQVYTARDESGLPVVLAIFSGVTWDEGSGLLGALAIPGEQVSSVGTREPGALAIPETHPGSVGNSPRGALAVVEQEE